MRRKFSALSSIGLAIGLVLGMVALAPPSHATIVSLRPSPLFSSPIAIGDSLTVTVELLDSNNNPITTGAEANNTIIKTAQVAPSAPGTVGSVSVPATGPTIAGKATFTITGVSAGLVDVAFELNDGTKRVLYLVNVTGGGGNNGGTSSGAAASAPVEVSLSLDLATSDASCTGGSSATGVMGTWLSLPGAGDCTSQTTPEANLLGWATTADFPVDIAQRQIDNDWGAYELFNEEGRMTAVFIPAGQATFVSGPNTLHPIWAS